MKLKKENKNSFDSEKNCEQTPLQKKEWLTQK